MSSIVHKTLILISIVAFAVDSSVASGDHVVDHKGGGIGGHGMGRAANAGGVRSRHHSGATMTAPLPQSMLSAAEIATGMYGIHQMTEGFTHSVQGAKKCINGDCSGGLSDCGAGCTQAILGGGLLYGATKFHNARQ